MEDIKKAVYYDETSPTGIRWAVDIYYHNSLTKKITRGDVAGSWGDYWQVKYKQVRYATHRVIWEMFNGSIPEGMMIDHVDGDRQNNRISNLRLANHTINSQNMRRGTRNKSGVAGVSFIEVLDRDGITLWHYWKASWRVGGKNKSCHFSVKDFGYNVAKEMAVQRRQEELKNLNINGADYTERHGQ